MYWTVQRSNSGLSSACFDADMKLRYSLSRRFEYPDTPFAHLALFVMLNPSTADALKDDPTIRRLNGFTKAWGLSGFDVVNLFAHRATNPKELLTACHPATYSRQELDEDAFLEPVLKRPYALICYAWGAGVPFNRDRRFVRMAESWTIQKPWAFGYTKNGFPLHPLRLPASQKLVPFELKSVAA